mmetsp:Transcript_2499/g.2888  ORF Transcript_2499/g.2888 Transcript_2499/m.2888 type:complete len:106 (+) Transcript_2499:453-770(+)
MPCIETTNLFDEYMRATTGEEDPRDDDDNEDEGGGERSGERGGATKLQSTEQEERKSTTTTAPSKQRTVEGTEAVWPTEWCGLFPSQELRETQASPTRDNINNNV